MELGIQIQRSPYCPVLPKLTIINRAGQSTAARGTRKCVPTNPNFDMRTDQPKVSRDMAQAEHMEEIATVIRGLQYVLWGSKYKLSVTVLIEVTCSWPSNLSHCIGVHLHRCSLTASGLRVRMSRWSSKESCLCQDTLKIHQQLSEPPLKMLCFNPEWTILTQIRGSAVGPSYAIHVSDFLAGGWAPVHIHSQWCKHPCVLMVKEANSFSH